MSVLIKGMNELPEDGAVLTVKHEKCPLKTEEECLAVAAQMVLDFVNGCEGTTIRLKTSDGKELDGDWGYVLEGLEEIIKWAERRKNAKV